jgi:hypothetical protein
MSNEGHPTQWISVNPHGHTGRRRVRDDDTKHPGQRRYHGAQQTQGEAQELGRGAATGRHRRTRHEPGHRTANGRHRRRPNTLHAHTRHTHRHAGRPGRSRGARTPANARPPPNPDHPSFPGTPHQGGSACSPCSIGALSLNRNNTQIHRRAVGRHTRVDSGS